MINTRSRSKKDLISNLPDAVTSQILSRLPTKQAVQTSVLSKNWRYKWASIYNFYIKDGDCNLKVGEVRNQIFIKFVDRILDRTETLSIKDFHLECYEKYKKYNLQNITRWIDNVLRRKVENLTIKYCYHPQSRESIVFPRFLFDCNSLTRLDISLNCTLEVLPLQKCFSQLKKLSFGHSFGSGDGVFTIRNGQSSSGELVLDFPVLQEVRFWNCKWLDVNSLEIKAPALIMFKAWYINNDRVNDDFVIKLSAANLATFEEFGFGSMENYILSSPLVTHATLIHHSRGNHESNGLRANTMLKALPGLTHLEVSKDIVEGLVQARKSRHVLPNFDRLKKLEMVIPSDMEVTWLEFLKMTPYIESLCMHLQYHLYRGYEDIESSLPQCLVSHLKVIKLTEFQGKIFQVDLVKFILKNAKKLQKLLVSVPYYMGKSELKDIKVVISELQEGAYPSVPIVISRW